jgi:hypothetical protein
LGVASVLATASSLMWLAVHPSPFHLVDQCGKRGNRKPLASVIVVGVLADDTLVRRPIPIYSDPEHFLQLRKLTVNVENVPKGTPMPSTIEVYYFTYYDGYDGPPPLGYWNVGDRRILWLRRDSGLLRTVCDGWDGCTKGVWSGAHPHYTPDPRKSLDYALVDLLFTRGEGDVDENRFGTGLLDEIGDNVQTRSYAVEHLKRLVLTEHGFVKSSACEMLFIYSVDRIEASTRREAADAMLAGNCRCAVKSYSPECE